MEVGSMKSEVESWNQLPTTINQQQKTNNQT
jgi:hypothetical protein